MSTNKQPKYYDFYARGQKQSSPLATTIFVGLRALDPFIQYQILAKGVGASLLTKVGLQIIPDGAPIQSGIPFIDNLGLSPYRLLLLAMATGGALKQIVWALYISKEKLWVSSATAGPIYNTVCNSTNDLLATTAFFSAGVAGRLPAVILGAAFYVFGIVTETVSEMQRKKFKDDARNDGKLYSGGLWTLTRHINYTGYASWRAGYSLAAGNWYWGGFAALYLFNDFGNRAIPTIDLYCSQRYGEQWEEFKRKTPYKIIPYVW